MAEENVSQEFRIKNTDEQKLFNWRNKSKLIDKEKP